MKLSRSIRFAALSCAVVLFAALSITPQQCQAQRRRFVLGQEVGRFLGVGSGAGYHCANPGQSTGYYNPYTAHNSLLISAHEPNRSIAQGFSVFNSNAVPHSVYTGQNKNKYAPLEALPGRSVEPTFEPAVDRLRKNSDEATFEPDLDFNADAEDDADFDTDANFNSDSVLDGDEPFDTEAMDDDAGGFEALQENFDEIQDEDRLLPNRRPLIRRP